MLYNDERQGFLFARAWNFKMPQEQSKVFFTDQLRGD
jgi:hypothetical protein